MLENKINLGCGADLKEGFINVDIREEVKPDILCDIRTIPVDKDSIEYIYCKDVLEHFWKPEAVLSECSRVLKTGREMEAIVPDWHTLGDSYYWRDKDHSQVEKHVFGGHKNPYDQHHTMWTEDLAKRRFFKSGFKNVSIEHIDEEPLHWHMRITAEQADSLKRS